MTTGYVQRIWLALASGVLALLAFAVATADAARVANPGPVTFRFEEGTLTIRDDTFNAGSEEDPATATGTIAANGQVTINSFHFPDIPPIDGPLGPINVTVNVLSSSGNVNPLTGAGSFSATIRIDIDGNGVGGDCKISPINLNMTTSAAQGVPYNTADGTLTVADHTFSVPGASGCSTFPINVNNEINNELGLPSPSGLNHAVLEARSIPILQKALVPSFTATPSSGVFPLNVGFDASQTFHTRSIANYQWDFDGGGFDQTTAGPTTSFTYTTAGTKTVRLRVTDADGDAQETTRQVIVDTPRPDLTIAKSHSGSFVTGNAGSYSIDVTNTGTLAATGTITVTDTLPAGFSLSGSSGSGWSCGAQSGQEVTCTTEDDVAIGASAPTLTLDVIAANPGTFVNSASVSTSGDINASNNTAEDTTNVIQSGIDLALSKRLDPDDGDLLRGRRATYLLGVTNQGTLPATERVRIVDTLPEDVEFVGAAGGPTWTCSYVAPDVRCFTDDDVDPNETLEDVRIRVEVAPDAGDEVINEAEVTVDGESDAADNVASHDGTVSGYAADYQLTKSHTGTFIAGEPGFYSLEVTNVGTATAGNTVTVLDQLPAGLTYDSATGDGWACAADGQDVTCQHAGGVEAGDSLPTLTIKVAVDAAAAPSVTNAAGLFSDDDFNVENNVASDPTEVRAPIADLAITKTHEGNFTGGSQGSYTIAVENRSAEPAPGPTTVTDALPAGLTFVHASGTGWVCAAEDQEVTCAFAGTIAGGAAAPPITVLVAAERAAANTTVENVATVANAFDTNGANDVARDPTVIADPQKATTITAYSWLLFVRSLDIKLIQGPQARLRDEDGNFVVGKTITFRNQQGGGVICAGVTDSQGLATCKPPLSWLLKMDGNGRYRAEFAGDDDYKPSTQTGSTMIVWGALWL